MECPHIPEIKYGEFSKHIHEEAVANRIPLDGAIEVTYRCNLNCVHCYCNLPINDSTAARQEMTYGEICNIVDQVAEEGCLWLLITGGEPLIRKDFIDIYTYIKKKGIIISLFTNGTMITPELADYLKEWPPFSVEISLYGISRAIYERVTGVPGSFDRCMRGIRYLLERKIPLKLKTTVLTLNLHELWDIKKYAESLGVEFRFDPTINPRLDGDKQPCQYRITPEEVAELDRKDRDRFREWKEFCQKFWGQGNPKVIYNCMAGLASFHIDPYCKLQICEMVKTPNFDLRQGKFKEGWYNLFPKIRSQKPEGGINNCARCELFTLCDQCPGWALLENNDINMPVEYLCLIAHQRAKILGIKEVEKNGRQIKTAV